MFGKGNFVPMLDEDVRGVKVSISDPECTTACQDTKKEGGWGTKKG
jgi:hypothetical protein